MTNITVQSSAVLPYTATRPGRLKFQISEIFLKFCLVANNYNKSIAKRTWLSFLLSFTVILLSNTKTVNLLFLFHLVWGQTTPKT